MNTTGELGVDQVLSITAPGVSSGEYTYYCQNHSGMDGDFVFVPIKLLAYMVPSIEWCVKTQFLASKTSH